MRSSSVRTAGRVALVVGLCVVSAPSSADGPPGPELVAARQALHHYDRGGGTTEVIARLTRLVERTRDADQREARFLRAVAATDLLMLSYGPGHGERSRESLSEAVGVPVTELPSFLERELRSLEVGAYQEAAADSRWVLSALREGDHDPELLRTGHGLRRDILYVHAVVDAIGSERELETLARYAEPMPAEGPFAAFSEQGRQAVAALREASDAMRRLEVAARNGEPLTASLAGIVEVDGAILRSTAIQPSLRFPSPDAVHAVGTRGHLIAPDLIMWVDGRRLCYGFAPSVRVMRDHVEVTGAAEPTLPEFASVAIPQDGRSALMPYGELTDTLTSLRGRETFTTVGLAANSEVEAHAVSRLLVTMEHAGWPTPVLLARGDEGEVRGLPIALDSSPVQEGPPQAFEVYVRLGGYTVQRGAHSTDLPRVRQGGQLRFDHLGLESIVDDVAPSDASLRFMSVAPWGTVMDAGFRLARAPGTPVRFQLF